MRRRRTGIPGLRRKSPHDVFVGGGRDKKFLTKTESDEPTPGTLQQSREPPAKKMLPHDRIVAVPEGSSGLVWSFDSPFSSSATYLFGRARVLIYFQAQMLVESGEIAKKRGHEEPPPGQAGRDVESSLQPGLAHDLRLLTRVARYVASVGFMLKASPGIEMYLEPR